MFQSEYLNGKGHCKREINISRSLLQSCRKANFGFSFSMSVGKNVCIYIYIYIHMHTYISIYMHICQRNRKHVQSVILNLLFIHLLAVHLFT